MTERFNYEGITYEVTAGSDTQIEGEAVTGDQLGQVIVVDRKSVTLVESVSGKQMDQEEKEEMEKLGMRVEVRNDDGVIEGIDLTNEDLTEIYEMDAEVWKKLPDAIQTIIDAIGSEWEMAQDQSEQLARACAQVEENRK